jgi:hypothetical protein
MIAGIRSEVCETMVQVDFAEAEITALITVTELAQKSLSEDATRNAESRLLLPVHSSHTVLLLARVKVHQEVRHTRQLQQLVCGIGVQSSLCGECSMKITLIKVILLY